jgi:hypothetical protein
MELRILLEHYSGDEIKAKIYDLANSILGIDFDQYLQNENKRAFWGLLIENDNSTFHPYFGEPTPAFLEIMNGEFRRSEAGYKVNVGSVDVFQALDLNADIFIINGERLCDNRLDLDALILHELCHMVIDANIVSDISVKITEKDEKQGYKLFEKTYSRHDTNPMHPEIFCNLLASLSTKTSKVLAGYKNRWDVINRAMKYDIF